MYVLDLFLYNQNQAWLYDFEASSWTDLPPMLTGRQFHACGVASLPPANVRGYGGGRGHSSGAPAVAVVAGGTLQSSAEMFDFDTMTWR